MANYVFTPAKTQLAAGALNWQTNNTATRFYALFIAEGYSSYLEQASVTSAAIMTDLASIASYQYAGAGYVQGGMELAASQRTLASNGGLAVLDAADIVIPSLTSATNTLGGTIRDIVIYAATTGGTNSSNGSLVARLGLGQAYAGAGASFTVSWAANGVLQIA